MKFDLDKELEVVEIGLTFVGNILCFILASPIVVPCWILGWIVKGSVYIKDKFIRRKGDI